MAGSGKYVITLDAMINDSKIRAQIAAIQKQINTGAIGAAGGKGGKSGTTMIADAGKTAKRTTKEIDKMKKSLTGVQRTSKGAGLGLLDVTKKVMAFGAVTSAIQMASQGVRSMVGNVVELDGALREYKKVSDLTGKGLEDFTKKAYEAGSATAKTGVEMIEAATEFKKMGYTDEQSLNLAETATMFQNIADTELTAAESAKFINSQIKAFNMTANDSINIIDKVNEVANRNAVGTNDLQLALTKAGSAMGTLGNSYEQTIGLVTAGTEIMVGQSKLYWTV